MIDALYRLFTTPLLFPSSPNERRALDDAVASKYAESATQGHAEGYRITPDGYREANRRWGHQQIGDRL